MDKDSIRKEIASLINSIKEHSDNIGNGHIPQLELELILHKIEKLYQKSIVFNHLHSVENNSLPDADKKQKYAELPREEIKPVDLFGTEISAGPAKAEKKPEKREERKEEKKEEKPAAQKLQKPAVADLRSVIGINDKFFFANELFGGVMQEYEIAIQQLNSAGSLDSAMDYFISLQPLYNWDMEGEAVKRMLELIDRRYS